MSEEMTEMFQDIKAVEALNRRERKEKRLVEIKQLLMFGYSARAMMGDLHWRIWPQGESRHMDYWPSTGRFAIYYGNCGGRPYRGTLYDEQTLLDLLKNKLPREVTA